MNWLDLHAGAVQAAASVISAAVTVVLAFLTGRYVRLTQTLANEASAQSQHVRASAEMRRKESAMALVALAARIRAPLVTLDSTTPSHSSLFKYSQLEGYDIVSLEALSREVGGKTVSVASEAAVGLREIFRLIELARETPLTTGWIASPVETRRYYEARQQSLIKLDELQYHCEQVAA